MANRTRKIKYPTIVTQFDPATDIPLRYFPVKETFVRATSAGNYKLFCGHHLVSMVDRNGFVYAFPSYHPNYEPFVEAFMLEYAHHTSFAKIKPHLGQTYIDYMGSLFLSIL